MAASDVDGSLDEFFGKFQLPPDAPAQVHVRIELGSGLVIEGPIPRGAPLFRDPSDLTKVLDEIPAGCAISVVLPASTLKKMKVLSVSRDP